MADRSSDRNYLDFRMVVLDLIEAARPIAEEHVLNLMKKSFFRWRDFDEDSRGVVRVLAPLSHRLAEAMPSYALKLSPIVEEVAKIIADASPYDVSSPSVLTKKKHREAAQERVDENHGNSPEAIIEIPHPVRAAVGH